MHTSVDVAKLRCGMSRACRPIRYLVNSPARVHLCSEWATGSVRQLFDCVRLHALLATLEHLFNARKRRDAHKITG